MTPETRVGQSVHSLDPILEHRLRLAACVLLSRVDALAFSRLKQLMKATDGNLGAQLRKLEGAGYVAIRKEFVDRKPVSWYSLTQDGRHALQSHLAALETFIQGAELNGSGS